MWKRILVALLLLYILAVVTVGAAITPEVQPGSNPPPEKEEENTHSPDTEPQGRSADPNDLPTSVKSIPQRWCVWDEMLFYAAAHDVTTRLGFFGSPDSGVAVARWRGDLGSSDWLQEIEVHRPVRWETEGTSFPRELKFNGGQFMKSFLRFTPHTLTMYFIMRSVNNSKPQTILYADGWLDFWIREDRAVMLWNAGPANRETQTPPGVVPDNVPFVLAVRLLPATGVKGVSDAIAIDGILQQPLVSSGALSTRRSFLDVVGMIGGTGPETDKPLVGGIHDILVYPNEQHTDDEIRAVSGELRTMWGGV